MKTHHTPHRRAAAWLFAAAALPIAPLAAQDAPVVYAPPPVVSAPAPAPAPPPSLTVNPPRPTINLTPPSTATRTTPAPAPRTTRVAPAPRAAAPVRQAAPVQAAPAPAAESAPAPFETPAPIGAFAEPSLAPPPTAEVAPAAVEPAAAPVARSYWPWIAGAAALLLAAIAFFALRRRRRDEEEVYHGERAHVAPEPAFIATPEPAFAPAVAAAVPVAHAEAEHEPVAPPEEIHIAASEPADLEALAASSEPEAGRPWLEFLMRPLRAGTSRDNTIVEFELTVGNTGSVPAHDVRISTWVVAAGEATEMERMLIDPPADAAVQEIDIAAGEGALVEAKIGLAKDGIDESVLPVVHADARYTLPDGTEGRTHASFAVGVPEGDALAPFLTDRSSGLRENVEARLFGKPERV